MHRQHPECCDQDAFSLVLVERASVPAFKRETVKRLEKLGEQLDGGKQAVRKRRTDGRPIAGTRLIREWQGVPREVVVGVDYFEYEGKRYKSLSSIATRITGIQRNGWTFFGFSSERGV